MSGASEGEMTARDARFQETVNLMLPFWGEALLGVTISIVIIFGWLLPRRLVLPEDVPLVFWFLFLPITFAIRLVRSLRSDEDIRVKRARLGRTTRSVILGILFAFLGFVVGGSVGAFVGVLMGGIISGFLARSWNDTENRRRAGKQLNASDQAGNEAVRS